MMQTAKLMLLSASNAKGVAARAGDQATGFRPITDFIVEMANDTIHYATSINQLALSVTSTSVAAMRAHEGAQRFKQASSFMDDDTKKAFVQKLIDRSENICSEKYEENREIMNKLNLQLDEINQRVRGSSIVVSTSRTEASRAGDFQKYLNSIANSVEESAKTLHDEIIECRKLITQLENLN